MNYAAGSLPPIGNPPEGELARISGDLHERGYGASSSFISLDLCRKLSFELTMRLESGEFSPAGVGRDDDRQINRDIRSDLIKWWDLNFLSPVQKEYLSFIETLRDYLAEFFRIPLTELEIFYSSYPSGGFYKKHYDNFEGLSRRLITTVLYLNEDWNVSDGGNLRVWPEGKKGYSSDILPEFGTMAYFLTPDTLHEVLKTSRERKSIVCWMGSRNDPLKTF